MTADLKKRMDGTLASLATEFGGLRTGRASSDLLAPVMVEAYGASTPLAQVGSVNVADARMLVVNVWDKSLVGAVEKAIRDAGLGLNPAADGQNIRVPLPALTEERRKELVKLAKGYGENAKVALRNIRRDGMDELKKQKADGALSEDGLKRGEGEIQKLTDEYGKKVDDLLAAKEKDILTV